MNEKLVSIITPTYNCAVFISETIESVQAQTYQNWEMVIVDDCSTDNTREIVLRYAKLDPRIHYHLLERNSGAAIARTAAMHLAKGSYMAFLDSDDIWMPDKLSKQIAWMQKNGYAFSGTSYTQIDESGTPTGKTIESIPKTNYNRLLLDCPVGNSSVVYDVEKIGKFEVPNIRKRNDVASNAEKRTVYLGHAGGVDEVSNPEKLHIKQQTESRQISLDFVSGNRTPERCPVGIPYMLLGHD